MKEIIFNYNDYKSKGETYKDFYRDIVIKLDAKNNIDFSDTEDLWFNADALNEFLWYNSEENIKLIFVNFDLEKIKRKKTSDDYKWFIVLDVINDFVTKYPNNALEFRSE